MAPPNADTAELRAQTSELWSLGDLAEERKLALRVAWSAFWSSRAIVWAAGMAAVLAFGWFPETGARLDPFYFTQPFHDSFANLLVAPAARWDSSWYLAIAQFGYEVPDRAAFFPLFPALLNIGGSLTGSALVFGILLSSACGLGALYLMHRLVSIDFGVERARTSVWMLAWFPSAIFLSAVYTEGLFLLLSLGSLYAGRRGRWAVAGLLGGFAAATRSNGMLILVPLAMLYLYGPRADRPPESQGGLRPRYRLRADAAWLALIPAGVLAYLAYLGAALGDPLAAFTAQSEWARSFVPLGAIALGAESAVRGFVELLPGVGPDNVLSHGQSPEVIAIREIVLFGFLGAALWLTWECWKRLPAAYTAYVICGLALPLSVPGADQPLMSLPRFMFVLFPFWIALALWAHERDRVRPVLVVLGVLLAAWSGLFATWSWAP